MKKNIISYLLMAFAMSLAVTSCIKDDVAELGTAGTARIKILEAPRRSLFFSPFTTVQNIDLFSVRRDEVSSAGIDQAITVKVIADTAGVTAYNEENGTTYEFLPDSIYTIVANGVTISGNEITLPIAAKTVGTELSIAMNGSKWDVSHKYAMMYTIVDSAGLRITSGMNSVFVTIEAKNQWDGIYEVTGSMADIYIPTLTHITDWLSNNEEGYEPPMHYELRTISPTECVVYDNYVYGGYYIPISDLTDPSAPGVSAYGSFAPILEFDPETNKIVKVTNYYGQPASNTRSAHLDPTGASTYDPETKSFSLKYYMTQPSVITDPPHIRVRWDEQWKYIGPRE